ncbi:MAG: hypothetical protein DI536_27230 [Archangium gephyra]|uniref:Uncharacterized protein n=1 Tax=Archangium gephyra TaxID=48 RepID=A0A2W5T5P6_9BACT|nr:MAG: hypothetical protein DI536_27230 [Archangium gephyra]
MKKIVLALVLSGCAVAPLRTVDTPTLLDARSLEGTWRVEGTTFPMWLDGTKQSPRFTYANFDGPRMDDTVSYEKNGVTETIEGVDTQHSTIATHFTWRGRGLLSLFKSEWDVVYVDARDRFAIITFSKTLATPAGLDVIARKKLDDAAWSDALEHIDAHAELKALASGLQRLP